MFAVHQLCRLACGPGGRRRPFICSCSAPNPWQVRRLVDCCYDLLPPDHQAQLVQRHGSEEEARAWVADGVQETIILASRAALCATHGHLAWLQGAHAVLPLGSLSAGAQAAAAAVTGQQRRLLQLVGQVLELVLVPAAELCAGQKVDHASNNGCEPATW